MKLAEALQERADLNERIRRLSERLKVNAIVQEDEKPAEEPAELLKELDSSLKRLEELITRINLTNCKTVVEERSLTEHIARKDCLKLRLERMRELVSAASQTGTRARYSEIKLLSTVDVNQLNKQIDDCAKELRLTDNLIQATNWETELI